MIDDRYIYRIETATNGYDLVGHVADAIRSIDILAGDPAEFLEVTNDEVEEYDENENSNVLLLITDD